VKVLTNPVVVTMVLLGLAGALAVLVGFFLIRRMRRQLLSPGVQPQRLPSMEGETFAAAAFQGVIQRLKEQEKELNQLRQRERERAEASETISAAVLSNLASGVLLFNPSGMVRQANQAARGVLGYASPIGLHARQLFQGASSVRQETGESVSSAADLVEAVELALREGRTFRRLEVEYTTPGGVARVLGVTLSRVRAGSGEALGVACLVSDLTEITNLERQMRLRENLASLGEMSAGIAHEFKNSLATISGYAQMLRTENPPETVQEFSGKIVSETNHLTRIVTDFLNFARPLGLVPEPLEARVLLEECAQECGVDLRLSEVPSGLPLIGDRTALRQAFSNLLRNSAESGKNGMRVTVEVSARLEGTKMQIILRDNGAGIPQEHLPRIFLPFFTTKSSGTGLGLALVHRIVTEHGGEIGVGSDASGSTFTLSFPARQGGPNGPEQG